MAGHSKFKNIQFRKDRQDAARSKLFSKFSRDITIAAKAGLPDPAANSRLRLAIANAKAESMPKDNIDRAIKKALGGETDTYEEIRYEGFGPGGASLIVEVLTDNRNRAAANVRTIFGKNGGNMGDAGSVAFMFDRLGRIAYPRAAGSDEAILEAAIEARAHDVRSDADGHVILTAFEDMAPVADALEGASREQPAAPRRHAAEQRRSGEECDAGDEHAPAAEQIAGPRAEEQETSEGKRVGGDHPREVRRREVQCPGDVRQGDVHDGRVEHDHQLDGKDDAEHQAPAWPALGCPAGRGDESGGGLHWGPPWRRLGKRTLPPEVYGGCLRFAS